MSEVFAPLEIDTGEVIQLLTEFLRNEVEKVGYSRVIFGLSGGVDSAVVAALAARAFPPDSIHAILMPYQTSTESSKDDARAVCTFLGLEPVISDISPQIDAYFSHDASATPSRRGNKMARERMTVLYDLSERYRALVVGTSNKSELLLGYGTIFGDMAHAINPLGDMYKTQVFTLAKALDLPDQVRTKPPSADLWEGQLDEQELGFTYHEADQILYYLVDERRSPEEIEAIGHDRRIVHEILQKVKQNQYKRRLPVIAKLGPRTIDRDFRYARDWGH